MHYLIVYDKLTVFLEIYYFIYKCEGHTSLSKQCEGQIYYDSLSCTRHTPANSVPPLD
jgi:hypothetical protein